MNRADQYYLPSEIEYRRKRAMVKRRGRRWSWTAISGSGGRGSREIR
jgi:hypothetical protein